MSKLVSQTCKFTLLKKEVIQVMKCREQKHCKPMWIFGKILLQAQGCNSKKYFQNVGHIKPSETFKLPLLEKEVIQGMKCREKLYKSMRILFNNFLFF